MPDRVFAIRILIGILAGIGIALLVLLLVEILGNNFYPLPVGFDVDNPNDLRLLTRVLPPAALLLSAASWFLASLAGGWIASRIARRRWTAWVVAAVVILTCVDSFRIIPHPPWMLAAGLLLPLAGAWRAQRGAA